MIRNAYILPTGNEVRDGVIIDTNSPMLMQYILAENPVCQVTRVPPLQDQMEEISASISKAEQQGADLIILIGGSGEGHRHSEILGVDVTHYSMARLLTNAVSTSLYGKNGHMWCRLVCGYLGGALVFNVPGPFAEAQAAIKAFFQVFDDDKKELTEINSAMAQAVKAQYCT